MENISAPNAAAVATDRNSQWREFRDSLYAILERIAREKIWFLVGVALSTLTVQIIVSGIEISLFGLPPEGNVPDPNALPRFVFSLIGGIYGLFIILGMVGVVRLWAEGQAAGWKAIFSTTPATWLKACGASILFFAGVIIGLILLIVPGIWFALTYQFVITAIAADPNLSIKDAFRKSKKITQGRRWNVLVTTIALNFRFWWNKGGKWSFLGLISSLLILVIVQATKTLLGVVGGSILGIAMNIITWAAYTIGFVSVFAFIITGIYTGIVTQFVNMPLIFFGLTNKQAEEADDSTADSNTSTIPFDNTVSHETTVSDNTSQTNQNREALDSNKN